MTQHDPISIGTDQDVSSIMEHVRSEVIRKRKMGIYPPEVAAEIDDVMLRGQEAEEDALERAIIDASSSRFTALIETGSRRPVIGSAISFVKRTLRRLLVWYVGAVVDQIRFFAFNVTRALRMLNEKAQSLERRMTELETLPARVQELENAFEPVSVRLSAVEEARENERALDRLARLDRAVRDLRERLDAGQIPVADRQEISVASTGRSRKAERSIDYFEFENRFRGSEEDVTRKQESYVDLFRSSAGNVVDLGCGRGEFLTLLKEAGVDALGVDRHPDMLAYCREQGLEVVEGDALDFLGSQEPESIGGVFCSHMIEHLDPSEVGRLFELAGDVLKPGGMMVVETPNPKSLFIFASAFYVDLGHIRPIHPVTVEFLAQAAGFSETRVEYHSPVPADFRPQPVDDGQGLDTLIGSINDNFQRIDDILFGPQDYVLIARR